MVEISIVNEQETSQMPANNAQLQDQMKLKNNDVSHHLPCNAESVSAYQTANYQSYYGQQYQPTTNSQYNYQYSNSSSYNNDYYYYYNNSNSSQTNYYANNQFANSQHYQQSAFPSNSSYYNYAGYDNSSVQQSLYQQHPVIVPVSATPVNETVNDSSSLLSISSSSSSANSSCTPQSPQSPVKPAKQEKNKKSKKSKNVSTKKDNQSESDALTGPTDLSQVNIDLSNMCLWDKFHQHTTEMIITKQGRYVSNIIILLYNYIKFYNNYL